MNKECYKLSLFKKKQIGQELQRILKMYRIKKIKYKVSTISLRKNMQYLSNCIIIPAKRHIYLQEDYSNKPVRATFNE